jgi:membrane protein required for colicin V production
VHLLDWILLIIVVVSVVPALVKGFVYEALMMAATVAAIILGIWKYPALAAHMGWVHVAPLRSFLAFLFIFIAVLLAAALAARLLRKMVQAAGLGMADRLLGGALGLVRGVVICLALLIAMTAFPFDLPLVHNSRFAPDFLTVGEAFSGLLPAQMRHGFQHSLHKLATASAPRPRHHIPPPPAQHSPHPQPPPHAAK